MSIIGSNILAGASGQAGGGGAYEIQRSLRFNAPDSSFLSRTPGTAGNRKTWTWAGWVKRSKLGTTQRFFATFDGSNQEYWRFDSNDTLRLFESLGTLQTTQVFRDVSAWYHIVVAVDTTQATASDRIKFYLNGTQVTTFSTATYPSQNVDGRFNSAVPHYLGTGTVEYFDGYLADIHFIDGQALDPSSFGEFDTNGVWQPIDASGLTFGTNGFHLPFSDNSTAAALGTDTSGNGNTWTVNNLAVGSAQGWDKSQVWSNTASGSFNPTFPASHAFNGQHQLAGGFDQTYATAGDPSGGTFTITSLTPNAAAEVGVYQSASVSASNLVVNGVSIGAGTGAFESKVYTGLSVNGSGNLTVNFKNPSGTNFVSIGYIKVNGKFLVDPGVIDPGDSLVDSPTNGSQVDTGVGGEVVGNYCTWNPLQKNANVTLSNGNLDYSTTGGAPTAAVGTVAVSSGKWYYETVCTTSPWTPPVYYAGVVNTGTFNLPSSGYLDVTGVYAYSLREGGTINNGSYSSSGWSTAAVNDVIGVALDLDAGTVKFYKNNSLLGTISGLSGSFAPFIGADTNSIPTSSFTNFGQRQFTYTAPANHKALTTANLPTPLIEDGSTVMDVALYTGNGSTQTISGLNFSPDLVWIKNRAAADNHKLLDTVRGATEELESNTTDAEATNADGLTAFTSDGFSLGADDEYNTSSEAYVGWTWDAGSSTVTNTEGSISSQVRANASAGFSVVNGPGNTYFGGTLGHGLGIAPQFILAKDRDTSAQWYVYHKSLTNPNNYYLTLNSTAAQADFGVNLWNVTSTTIASDQGITGRRGVYYCFAPVAGYSSFGSYTGNGSASDGPFVYTGFRPKFVIQKQISAGTGGQWVMFDSARKTYNSQGPFLLSDSSAAEGADTEYLDFLSNGFKFRTTNATLNGSAVVSIYIAFAEHPFATARAR